MKIAHFGTFDVDNYGDLLFPLVIERRMPNCDFVHISPIGGDALYPDCFKTIDINEASKIKFDAVIVGGGNIINISKDVIQEYQAVNKIAYPSIWIGASALAYEQKIPLAVNAPSISIYNSNPSILSVFIEKFVSGSCYSAFRDRFSYDYSKNLCPSKDISLVPDTAFDVDELWDNEVIESRVKKLNLDKDVNYISFHMNSRYLNPDIEGASRKIDEICEQYNCIPLLLVIGKCHNDLETAKNFENILKTESLIVDPEYLCDIASAIYSSCGYIGSSMHGFISSLAFGKSSRLLLGEKPLPKFGGLLEHVGFKDSCIYKNWSEVRYKDFIETKIHPEKINHIKFTLDSHWANLEKSLLEGRPMVWPAEFKIWQRHFQKTIDNKKTLFEKITNRLRFRIQFNQ